MFVKKMWVSGEERDCCYVLCCNIESYWFTDPSTFTKSIKNKAATDNFEHCSSIQLPVTPSYC